MKMHEDEVRIDVAIVRRLVDEQFPEWAGLQIREVESTGTVNAIHRIGEAACARLPRRSRSAGGIVRELRWLPWVAKRISLAIPRPIGAGRPGSIYPFPWGLYRWIDGQPYSNEGVEDERQAARDLAQFVLELRSLDTSGAPPAGRKPLLELDSDTRSAIEAADSLIDARGALAAWDEALATAVFHGEAVWIHADLLRPNTLTRSGRIRAILDFGAAGAGDPAADVIAAWSIFGPVGREEYRSTLNVDDETWRRARGYALHQAALIIPYYSKTNPAFTALAQRTVKQVLLDGAKGR
jgi:aminoglycoside phosphotransferase (APT) family kinase protein